MTSVPSGDTEASPVLTLAMQLAPGDNLHEQGGKGEVDDDAVGFAAGARECDQIDKGADAVDPDAASDEGDQTDEGEDAVDADLGSHSLL